MEEQEQGGEPPVQDPTPNGGGGKKGSPCEECGEQPWKYRCPGCSRLTCSLPCVQSHKRRTACTGKRPRTDPVPLSQFDDNQLLSDYNFLEETKQVRESAYRLIGGFGRNFGGVGGVQLPKWLFFLRKAAQRRVIWLHFLPRGMTRREQNRSRHNHRQDCIYWTLEWRFNSTDVVLTEILTWNSLLYCRYKASNDGKFPTIKTVCRHVGGSHYTVREILQEVEYNNSRLPLDKSRASQLHETAEFDEHSRPEDGNGNNSLNSQSFNSKQDGDDVLLSQKDAATSTEIMEKTETRGYLELKTASDSSHYNAETEAAKQDLYTADILKITNDSTVSSQTESDAMKTEASISLGLETKSDPGNHQGDTEANKLDLNNTENLPNASEPAVSDHPEIDKVFKANVLDREENPELEHEESTKTSLLRSLKSFAYGIRNFWKKL